jgi:hypothetical protein
VYRTPDDRRGRVSVDPNFPEMDEKAVGANMALAFPSFTIGRTVAHELCGPGQVVAHAALLRAGGSRVKEVAPWLSVSTGLSRSFFLEISKWHSAMSREPQPWFVTTGRMAGKALFFKSFHEPLSDISDVP